MKLTPISKLCLRLLFLLYIIVITINCGANEPSSRTRKQEVEPQTVYQPQPVPQPVVQPAPQPPEKPKDVDQCPGCKSKRIIVGDLNECLSCGKQWQ
jgi:hypothetical protein